MYMGHPKGLMSMPPNKWDTMLLGTGCLVTDSPLNWKSRNALRSPTTLIHNYKKHIILHINTDFHYKAMYNYHQLVSLLFSFHDCMSLNQNDDWCPFASRSRLEKLNFFLPMTGFLDTKSQLNGWDLWYTLTELFQFLDCMKLPWKLNSQNIQCSTHFILL